ncbi:hypothetical protein [Streptomyces mirabilis]|uniref:hypothetical protein n=1 Tax=Streptomyces mirabilis TaxID=68239 RepID=UPI002258DD00|nr:hypothetical protein [Streptomyces mirabilis]MCX4429669.1 hypothetical protein [Streptomyces mirabilis]
MHREKESTADQYVYRIGGWDVVMSSGPGEQMAFEELPDVGAWVPDRPVSYGKWDAEACGMQVYDPRPVDTGKPRVSGAHLWFPTVVDGVLFEVMADDDRLWRVTVGGREAEPLWQSRPTPRPKGCPVTAGYQVV